MRELAFVLALAACHKQEPPAAGNDWVHPRKLISVHFPGKPQEWEQTAETQIGPVKTTVAMYEEADRAFSAAATVYKLPEGMLYDVPKGLEGAVDGMLGDLHAKATAQEPIVLDGLTGREVTFEAPGQGDKTIRGMARVFVGGDPVSSYVVFAFRSTETSDPDAVLFFRSVHIGKGVQAR